MDESLFSLNLEKHLLAGIIKQSKIYYEIAPFISDNDFYAEINSTLFTLIREAIERDEDPSPVLIAERIKTLGINFKARVSPFDYLKSLSLISITKKTTIEAAKQIKTLSIKRDLCNAALRMKAEVTSCVETDAGKIISLADSIYHSTIQSYEMSSDINNLFEDMQEVLEDLADNPVEDHGFLTPFPDFNKMYGGLRPANLYAFVARPKQGKSTLLADLLYKTANESNPKVEKKIKCLYMDTEMSKLDVQKRLCANISGVPFWYIDTGNWRKHPEFVKALNAAWQKIKDYCFYHIECGNKSTEEVLAHMRRWYYSQVGRGNPALICYDYLKMTGEKVSESFREYQIIGDKTDKFKKISEDLDCPVITSTQLNRSGEAQNKKVGTFSDDSSAIALSDRLQWYASFVGIFRKKTIDEMAVDGTSNGTHKLVPTATRFQGRDAAGFNDLVQREIEGKKILQPNYISFKVDNFRVDEVGNLEKIIELEGLDIDNFDEKDDKEKDSDDNLF